MLCKDIIDRIEQDYPKASALSWDNVGLLVGRDDKEVNRIYVALDATDEVISHAAEAHADLLITHHPMIFQALKKINSQDFIGRRILELAGNDISYYAIHTNYDVLGMAELSANILKLRSPDILEVTKEDGKTEGIGRIADLDKPVLLSEYAQFVKKQLELPSAAVYGDTKTIIGRVAVSPGSGKLVIDTAIRKKADLLIAGDIGHHEGIDALARGLCIIDAGHYGTEHIFIRDMSGYLEQRFPEAVVLAEPVSYPFLII